MHVRVLHRNTVFVVGLLIDLHENALFMQHYSCHVYFFPSVLVCTLASLKNNFVYNLKVIAVHFVSCV